MPIGSSNKQESDQQPKQMMILNPVPSLASSLMEDIIVPRAVEGFDVLRLTSPPLEQLNEDFLCAKCQKIVN
jgi:hypothetical protein